MIGEAGSVAEPPPGGDGFSLTEQLVAMPGAVRVVPISSEADRTSMQAAQRAGADSFLPKDELSSAALRQLIEGW